MTRSGRWLPFALAAGLIVAPAVTWAQVAEGNRLWTAGRFAEAGQAYARELATDPGSVRALYRLATLAAWNGHLDSALTLARRARAADPSDLDVRLLEAQILSWQGRLDAAIARYDSVVALDSARADARLALARTLAWANRFGAADSVYAALLRRDPGNPDALAGRAQLAAWQGDFDRAIGGYRAVLDADPKNLDALVGLGQVYHWQGDERAASATAARALAVDSASRAARDLAGAIRTAQRTRVETSGGWNNDSDHNTNFSQAIGLAAPVADHLTLIGSASLQESSDPVRSGSRTAAEGGLVYSAGIWRLTAAAGARRLAPDTAPTRTTATWRSGIGVRPDHRVSLGAGYAHYPFDDTALLLERRLDVDEVEGSADLGLARGTTLSAGGGYAWLSDGNHRTSVVAALTQGILQQFYLGVFGRRLGYSFKGTGYFSPDRFLLGEVRAGWVYARGGWQGRLSGGLGVQQAFAGARVQSAWHAEARVGHSWLGTGLIEAFGGYTNSLASSTTGAYRFRTAGLRISLGL